LAGAAEGRGSGSDAGNRPFKDLDNIHFFDNISLALSLCEYFE
jgi:hypothetical protein